MKPRLALIKDQKRLISLAHFKDTTLQLFHKKINHPVEHVVVFLKHACAIIINRLIFPVNLNEGVNFVVLMDFLKC